MPGDNDKAIKQQEAKIGKLKADWEAAVKKYQTEIKPAIEEDISALKAVIEEYPSKALSGAEQDKLAYRHNELAEWETNYEREEKEYKKQLIWENKKLGYLRDPSSNPKKTYTENTGITWEEIKIHGIDARIGRIDGQIVDVQANLTEAQIQDLIMHFDDKKRDYKTSCYTYIFQSELAAFEEKSLSHPNLKKPEGIEQLAINLRTWSSYYADFEAMINNPPSGEDPLEALLKNLRALYKKFENDMEMPQALREELCKHIVEFMRKTVNFQKHSPTDEQIEQFFCIQPENSEIPCLGRFIAKQLTIMKDGGMHEVDELMDKASNTGFGSVYQSMHPLSKALSDAGSGIERKGLSLHGVRYNNTRDRIGDGMLAALRIAEHPSDNKKTYFSINNYINMEGNIDDMNVLFKRLAGKPIADKTEKKPSAAMQVRVFVANLVELPLAFLRIPASVLVAIPYVATRGLSMLLTSWWMPETMRKSMNTAIDNFFKPYLSAFDGLFSKTHQRFSLVRAAKSARNKQYHFGDKEETDDLNKLQTPKSFYDVYMSLLNGEKMGKFVSNAFEGILRTVLSPVRGLLGQAYSLVTSPIETIKGYGKALVNAYKRTFTPDKHSKDVFQKFKDEMHAKMMQTYNDRVNNVSPKETSKLKNPPKFPEGETPKAVRAGVERWKANEYSSGLDFFDEIFVGLSDVLIGPMFRKSPVAATFFFMLANGTFGALTFPTLVGGAYGGLMTSIAEVVAKGFMGKEIGASHMTNLMTTFLEWKLSFFGYEGGKEIVEGNFDFLKSLSEKPETFTLGLSIFIVAGWAMHFLPLLPPDVLEIEVPEGEIASVHGMTLESPGAHVGNIYAEILNIFIEESKEVAHHGLFPLTTLEFGFLSLKLGFLVHNMLEGMHESEKNKVDPDQLKIAQALLVQVKDENGKTIVYDEADQTPSRQKLLWDMKGFQAAYDKSRPLSKMTDDELRQYILGPALQKNGIIPDTPLYTHLITVMTRDLREACALTTQFNAQPKGMMEPLAHQVKDVATGQPAPPLTKRQPLMEAIHCVQMAEMEGREYSVPEAKIIYDNLSKAFKEYNNEQRALGNWDKVLPKEKFMHAFYNKHIYKGSNVFIRLVGIIPFYPVTRTWRWLQKTFDKSPSTQYKIKKSEAKDRAWAMQLPAIFARVGHELVRSYVYAFRGVALVGLAAPVGILLSVPATIITAIGSALVYPFSPKTAAGMWRGLRDGIAGFAKGAVAAVKWFAPFERQTPAWLRDTYTKDAARAGVSSDALMPESAKMMSKLQADEMKQNPTLEKTPWLFAYERKHANKNFLTLKSSRKKEKELLTRYATGMENLERRATALQRRIEALEKAGFTHSDKMPDYLKSLQRELNKARHWTPETEKDIQERIKYFEKYIDGLNSMSDFLDKEEEKIRVNAPPAITPAKIEKPKKKGVTFAPDLVMGPTGKAANKNTGVPDAAVKLDTAHHSETPHETPAEKVQQTMQHNQDIRHWASQKEIPEELRDQLGAEAKVVGVIALEQGTPGTEVTFSGKTTQLSDVAEVVENIEMFGSPEDLMEKLNDNDVQISIGGREFFIKGVLMESPEGGPPTVIFVKCDDTEDDPAKAPYVDAADVAAYAAKHPDSLSISSAITMRLCGKLKKNDKSLKDVTFVDAKAHQELHAKMGNK